LLLPRKTRSMGNELPKPTLAAQDKQQPTEFHKTAVNQNPQPARVRVGRHGPTPKTLASGWVKAKISKNEALTSGKPRTFTFWGPRAERVTFVPQISNFAQIKCLFAISLRVIYCRSNQPWITPLFRRVRPANKLRRGCLPLRRGSPYEHGGKPELCKNLKRTPQGWQRDDVSTYLYA